ALEAAGLSESATITAPGESAIAVDAGASRPSGNLSRDELKSVPLVAARVDAALPLIPGVVRSSKGEISIKGAQEQQSALLVNGAIVPGRVYLSQSLNYSISKSPIPGLSFPFNETKAESKSSFTQLDLFYSDRHTQTLTFGVFPEHDRFVGLNYFQQQPASPNYRQNDVVVTARDRYT